MSIRGVDDSKAFSDADSSFPPNSPKDEFARTLKTASADYLKGKISEGQLEEIEAEFSFDYKKAALNIASATTGIGAAIAESVSGFAAWVNGNGESSKPNRGKPSHKS